MPNALPPIYSAESILRKIESTRNFIDQSAKIINKFENEPTPDSRAFEELNSFAEKNLVEDVFMRATLCVESAVDHFMAFLDTVKKPAKSLAPYTCVRSLLESCSIALWLLDLDVDVKERVGRCLGFRYEEFEEQIKFLNSDKETTAEARKVVEEFKQKETELAARAISWGYQPLLSSKTGKMTGIGAHMPGIVELIEKTLDKEMEYRMLSGIAHAYVWATSIVGFRKVEATNAQGQKIKAFEKHNHPHMVIYGINIALPTLAKVLWVKGKLYGWDMQEIEGLLNHTFDELGFNNNLRFWC
jgi:hypothetical protein